MESDRPATIQAPRHNENCEPMEYNNTSGHTSSSGANVNYLSEDTFHTAQSSLLRGQTSTDDINDSDSFHTHVETNSISTTPTTSSQSSNNTIRPSHPKAITGVNGTPSASSSDDRSLTETAKQQNQQSSGKTKYCGPIPKITLNKSDSDTQQSPPRKSTKRPTPTGESRHTLTSSLVWRKSGPIFIPSLSGNTTSSSGTHNDGGDGNSADSDDDPIIKHGFLLCTEMVNGQDDKLPAAYKQRNLNSMGRYWRQLQVILTPEALECYDSRVNRISTSSFNVMIHSFLLYCDRIYHGPIENLNIASRWIFKPTLVFHCISCRLWIILSVFSILLEIRKKSALSSSVQDRSPGVKNGIWLFTHSFLLLPVSPSHGSAKYISHPSTCVSIFHWSTSTTCTIITRKHYTNNSNNMVEMTRDSLLQWIKSRALCWICYRRTQYGNLLSWTTGISLYAGYEKIAWNGSFGNLLLMALPVLIKSFAPNWLRV